MRVTRGVPSCILNIDRVESNMEGVWSFSVDRDVRERNISQRVEVELVMVELPDSVYLQYDNQQFRDTDREARLTAELGRASVQCVVEGGRPQPGLHLYVGDRNVTQEAGGGRFCRTTLRNSNCVQFDVDITADMSGEQLRWVDRDRRLQSFRLQTF